MTVELQERGLPVNHKRVLRIMRESRLLCHITRRFIVTTDSDHDLPVYPNVYRNQIATGLNQIWLADITYVRSRFCFVFLAVILDAFSRRAIGWALSKKLNTALTLDALRSAIEQRRPSPGCIHHSDQGVQYANYAYTDLPKAHGLAISMSRKGNPYDNAQAESFMATLKKEEVYLWDYETLEEARARLPYFIEQVYNHQRPHFGLGHVPPAEYELQYEQTARTPVRVGIRVQEMGCSAGPCECTS
jgi:transposase InsO family protein